MQNLTKIIIGVLAVVMLIVFSLPALSQDKTGTTAADFLGIAVGARSVAMGGAYTAVAGDATSIYWNPGAISKSGQSHANFIHTNWFLDTNFDWAGMVYNIDGTNAIGLSFTSLSFGDEPVTTVFEPNGTGDRFSAQDVAVGLSYSRNLTNLFSIGGTVKYISQKIHNETAQGFGVDVGLLFVTQFRDIQLGVSFSNLGSEMRLDGKDLLQRIDQDPNATGNNETIVGLLKTESYQIPVIFRVGLSGDLVRVNEETRLMFSVEAMQPNDNTGVVNLGGELAIKDRFFIRGGYKSLFNENSEEGLTLGGGVILDFTESTSLVLDYAFADFGLLENIQIISVGITF